MRVVCNTYVLPCVSPCVCTPSVTDVLASLRLSLPGSARSNTSADGYFSQPVRLELEYFDCWEDPAIHCCLGVALVCTFWMVGAVGRFLHMPWPLR